MSDRVVCCPNCGHEFRLAEPAIPAGLQEILDRLEYKREPFVLLDRLDEERVAAEIMGTGC